MVLSDDEGNHFTQNDLMELVGYLLIISSDEERFKKVVSYLRRESREVKNKLPLPPKIIAENFFRFHCRL